MQSPESLKGTTIAIIEDHPAVRDGMQRFLEACGASVLAFSTASNFLQKLPTAHCLILDYHMPGLCTLDLICGLRRQGFDAHIIVFTAMSDDALEHRATDLGIKEIVDKASGIETLLKAILRHTTR